MSISLKKCVARSHSLLPLVNLCCRDVDSRLGLYGDGNWPEKVS